MKNEMSILEKVKSSLDYRDICYFIDHIKDIQFRISLIHELGYTISIGIAVNNSNEKDVFVGKKNDARVQITPKYRQTSFYDCVVFNQEQLSQLRYGKRK